MKKHAVVLRDIIGGEFCTRLWRSFLIETGIAYRCRASVSGSLEWYSQLGGHVSVAAAVICCNMNWMKSYEVSLAAIPADVGAESD